MTVSAITQDAPPLLAAAAADSDAIFASEAVLARFAKKGATLSDSLPSVRVFVAARGGDVPGFGITSTGQRQNVRMAGVGEYTVSCPCAREGDSDAGGGVTATGPGSGKRVVKLENGDRFVVPGWVVGKVAAVAVVTVGGSIENSFGVAWNAAASAGEVPA